TQVLFDAAEAIRLSAVLLTPIMPSSSVEILRRLGVSSDGLQLERDGRWRTDGDRVLRQEGPLWPRFEPADTQIRRYDEPAGAYDDSVGADRRVGPKEIATLTQNPTPPPPTTGPAAPGTSQPVTAAERLAIDDFMKIELRVA